jgi:hypothetical protein
MKTIIGIVLLFASTQVLAQQPRHQHAYSRSQQQIDWVVPAILGGVIGYSISQSRQVPVVPTPPPARLPTQEVLVIRETVCTAWQEYHYPDGTVVRERTCR